ncbi:unnamed protein product [Larinioides sclopetarius]|uniref:Uncharacterized protein n=1 Tax=Larinioides sclopetarius TaxID=280406 RepID=A0AAV1ZT48_9ARAC
MSTNFFLRLSLKPITDWKVKQIGKCLDRSRNELWIPKTLPTNSMQAPRLDKWRTFRIDAQELITKKSPDSIKGRGACFVWGRGGKHLRPDRSTPDRYFASSFTTFFRYEFSFDAHFLVPFVVCLFRRVWMSRPTDITPPIIRAQTMSKHRTTVTISDPEEEEMNDIRLRTPDRRRTSSRRRLPDHKYARFPPMVKISTPVPSDDPSDTPSPNPSSELVRISTL